MKVTTNFSSNSSRTELDFSEKQINYGVQTRRSQLKLITSNIECDEALITAIKARIIASKLVHIFLYIYMFFFNVMYYLTYVE